MFYFSAGRHTIEIRGTFFMAMVWVIIGGVVGGSLGWLFDRRTRHEPQPETEDCNTRP
jgi:hypothetical protein